MKRIGLILMAMLIMAPNGISQIINVPADQASIQEGINAAEDSDTVLVAEGTYFENINFMGKAIVVASQFILDGDTSHISKTIIDGSQATDPDAASVVSFTSGEDTTSVITGFTITGGKGSVKDRIFESNLIATLRAGGGICFHHSGGKATFNVIEGNDVSTSNHALNGCMGGGVLARGGDGQLIALKHNIIRNNIAFCATRASWGGGAVLIGGAFLIENNTIENNSVKDVSAYSEGGGLFISLLPYSMELGLFQNNVIASNKVMSNSKSGYGGGIVLMCNFSNSRAKLVNNVIAENFVEGWDGGILLARKSIDMINNTVLENRAETKGNNLGIYGPSSDMVLINNIIWSDGDEE